MKALLIAMTLFSLNLAHASLVDESNNVQMNSLVNEVNTLLFSELDSKLNQNIHVLIDALNSEEKSVCDKDFKTAKIIKKNQRYSIKFDERAFSEKAQQCGLTQDDLELELLKSYAAIVDNELKISKDLSFQNAAGFFKSGLIFKRNKNLNQKIESLYADINLKKPKNALGLYLALYLKDESFACRHPSLNDYFNQKFNRVKKIECQATNTVVLTSNNPSLSEDLIKEIDFSRVYQIHYLFAGKGRAAMSRWGHAMFRIVMCKPGREVGPDCLKDISHHLVFGFRANVDELQISYLKGLRGKYESRIFIQPLYEVVEEYTDGEFRDVTSLPLKFSKEQITQFLNRSLEYYWTYKGRYYFLTNNCATEAIRLLKSAYLFNSIIQKESVVTPSGLYDLLIEMGLVNDDVLQDETNAIYKGYLFKGVDKSFAEALSLFTTTTKKLDEDLKRFQSMGAQKRLASYQAIFAQNKQNQNLKNIVTKALMLESKFEKALKQQLNNKILAVASGKIPLEGLTSSQELYLQDLVEVFTKFDPLKNATKESIDGLALNDEIDVEVIKENIKRRNDMLENEVGQEVVALMKKTNASLMNEVELTNKAKKELIRILGLVIKGTYNE